VVIEKFPPVDKVLGLPPQNLIYGRITIKLPFETTSFEGE
jgi:hypothetical protein